MPALQPISVAIAFFSSLYILFCIPFSNYVRLMFWKNTNGPSLERTRAIMLYSAGSFYCLVSCSWVKTEDRENRVC
ncbi:hypothetical protein BDV40DRAFT_67887 [Aspergillus tamarii]|uniref:Uncharacterized protein n=1 Tax=Aspergillus tamarii TaxID=41984 RepID=A0A5N6UEV2_ASPTM|nr:hypothetical protein BDV40DRAFT_67887 [Aspergillus tamarii]